MLPVLTIVVVFAGLLLSPGRVFSREMLWDLLFNVSGAWYIENGFTPHVDFHDPLGPLNFQLTHIGFRLLGPTAVAFLAAEILTVAAALAAAVAVATPRLTRAAAIVFVAQVTLLVLLPINVGDAPNAYSFAMSYNRWGWSALMLLGLLLFVEPRSARARWIDPLLALLLVEYMFYTKVTFALAGVALLCAGLLWTPALRRARSLWVSAIGFAVLDAALPHNRAYMADVWHATQSSYVRVSWLASAFSLLASRAEFALFIVGIAALVWLWRRGHTSIATLLSALTLALVGIFVLSQNQQLQEIPLLSLVLFMVAREWERSPGVRRGSSEHAIAVAMCLVYPTLTVVSYAGSILGYARVARAQDTWNLDDRNLKGLSVPAPDDGLQALSVQHGFRLVDQLEDVHDTAAHYVATLQEAVDVLSAARFVGRKIFTLDQVNALPFVMGYPPPRDEYLWLAPQGPFPPPDHVFRDVDVVLVPAFPSYAPSTVSALEHYGSYVRTHFPERQETASWTILSRTGHSAER